jgi:predicted hotdog family 3-hydroxylacyl-ACP dehydratase
MSFPPITELLPHRPPMLWVDEVLWHQGHEIRCALRIRADHVFVVAGVVEPVVSVEWMAQAVGALVGLHDRSESVRPRPGYLIAIPEAEFAVAEFRVGDLLTLCARRAWGDETLASFQGHVERDGALVARAQLSVYRRKQGAGSALEMP